MVVAISLIVLAIVLFVVAKKGWIQGDNIELGANIAAIVALLGAAAVFVVPAATSTDPKPTDTVISVPTYTPQPPSTSVLVPTSTKTVTIDVLPTPIVDDNFNDPTFNGKWNIQLWVPYNKSDEMSVKQQNGILELQREIVGDGGLRYINRPTNLSINDIGVVETKVMLDENIEASYGSVGLVITAFVNNDHWWLNCDVGNVPDAGVARVSCHTEEYYTNGVMVPYNSWHTMRIETNPETAKMKFFIDDKEVGSYLHEDREAFKDAEFNIELDVWSQDGGLVTGYIDDVQVNQFVQ